jgi:NitT/TauT family transport system permease protein
MNRGTRRRFERLRVLALQAAAVVVFVAAWEVCSRKQWINSFIFSRPSWVWDTLRQWLSDGTLLHAAGSTLEILLVGWLLGLAIGAALGILIGINEIARSFLEPFIVFLNGLPRLLFLPIFLIWFGFGIAPKIFLVIFAIVFVVAISLASGIREVENDLILAIRLRGGSNLDVVRDAYLPGIALWVMSSSRVTIGFAFQATVTSEFIGSNQGLGALLVRGQADLMVQNVYAALAVMFVLGLLLDALLAAVQRRAVRWMP